MKGFIANSSGSAYFQFHLFEIEKGMTISEILSLLGIRPNSVVHMVLKQSGVLDYILEKRKTGLEILQFLKEDFPDSPYRQATNEEIISPLPALDHINNDYFVYWTGWGLDTYGIGRNAYGLVGPDNGSPSSQGFLLLSKFQEHSKIKRRVTRAYYRTY